MLYGMGEPVRKAVIQNGQRVRVYLPVGELLPGIAYLIRRLMENTSNTSFLRQAYADEKDVEALIATPSPGKDRTPRRQRVDSKQLPAPGNLRNEPPGDLPRHNKRQ